MGDYNMALHYLTDDRWNSLTVYEKLHVLQTVENAVAFREGRHACQVSGEFIPSSDDAVTLGYYSQTTRDITINTEQLAPQSKYGSNYKVHLDTILHEGRHAYQHQVVLGEIEHPDPQVVQSWADNMAPGHYITYERNPRGYYSQPIERDARDFAREKAITIEQEKELALNPEPKPIVLARDENELRAVGLRNVEDILEVKRDDYRDKSIVYGPEMEQLIARDRVELLMELARDAFPGQPQIHDERDDVEQLFDDVEMDATVQDKQSMREAIEGQMDSSSSTETESAGRESGRNAQRDTGINHWSYRRG